MLRKEFFIIKVTLFCSCRLLCSSLPPAPATLSATARSATDCVFRLMGRPTKPKRLKMPNWMMMRRPTSEASASIPHDQVQPRGPARAGRTQPNCSTSIITCTDVLLLIRPPARCHCHCKVSSIYYIGIVVNLHLSQNFESTLEDRLKFERAIAGV